MNKINKAENDKKINNIKLQNKNYSFNTINKRYNENGKKYNNNIQRIDQNISSIVNNANYHNLKYKKPEAIENNFENKKNRNLTSNKTYLYKIENKEIKYALEQFLNNFNNNYKVDYYYPTNKYNNVWKLTILGPKKTPYEGKIFNFKLDFNKEFNYITDNILIEDKIYHLNFGEKGLLLFYIKYDDQKGFYENLLNLFYFLYNLFIEPNYEISSKIGEKKKLNLYKNDKEKYYENCKYFYA